MALIRINIPFFSLAKKRRLFIFCVFSALLILVAYLYVYEIIDIIAEEKIYNNLIPVDVSAVQNLCPLGTHNKTSFMPNRSVSKLSAYGADQWAKKLDILNGGEWQPKYCTARFLVAVIIPYRARENHLKEFFENIHPFLQKQFIHYKLYVIEQTKEKQFNRGKLFNVGFIEALKDKAFPCFIFHDIDLLPENEKNIYACSKTPRHMSAAIDKFSYRPPYYRNFGGVISILVEDFRLVNGFSNYFFGWGGEDDDFYNRIRNARIRPVRFDYHISQYYSLQHEPAKPNEDRFDLMKFSSRSHREDGLTSTSYFVVRRTDEPLFTRIVVDV